MKALFKALSDFQSKMQTVNADKQNTHLKNKYASLAAIAKEVNPVLNEVGLGYTQLIQDYKLITILFHVESGEQIQSEANLSQGKTAQMFGSDVTYMRRYSLLSMLGIVGDEDDDDGNKSSKPKAKKLFTEDDKKKWVEKVKSAQSKDEAVRYIEFIGMLYNERELPFEKMQGNFNLLLDKLFPIAQNEQV